MELEAGGHAHHPWPDELWRDLGVANVRAVLRLYAAIGCVLIPSLGLLAVNWAWVAGLLLAWVGLGLIGAVLLNVLGSGHQQPTRRWLRMSQEHVQLMMTDRDFDSCDYDRLLALDADNVVCASQRATDAEIRRLPIGEYTPDAKVERNCPICLEEFRAGEDVRMLPCWHRFHPACIDTWLRANAICPVCKFPAV